MTPREQLRLRFTEMLARLDPNPSPEGLIIQGLALVLEDVHTLPESGSFFDDVEEFHRKFGIQYDGPPREITGDFLKFRTARLREEFEEYLTAIEKQDVPGQVDALIDLSYIAFGTIHSMGVNGNEAWRRVQAANMSKELSHPGNPGKYGDKADIVKPSGWVAPDHSDLCPPPKTLVGAIKDAIKKL